MIFLGNLQHIKDNKYKVGLIHYKPELITDKSNGIEVEELPEPIQQEDTIPVLYVDMDTKIPYYEYEDAPVTEETALQNRISELEQQQANTEYILMLGGLL